MQQNNFAKGSNELNLAQAGRWKVSTPEIFL
jgi:hypothetical protein